MANASGLLLYPTVNEHLTEAATLDGHRICWETVDLARPWPEIEQRLSGMFKVGD
jgi:hypothetical protein